MKSLSVLLMIAVLLVACGPSAQEITATADAAQAQTETAAPTLTPTLTLTPTRTPTMTFTPSPTITPTATIISTPRARAKPGDTVPHDAPGPAPIGLPGPGSSEFFPSSSAGFLFEFGSGQIKYFISLDKGELPDGAILEIHFENPANPSTSIVAVIADLSEDTIFVLSRPISPSKLKCKNYWIVVHVFPDWVSKQEIGLHTQWVQSNFC